ncbi:hypothetical protein ACFU9B_41555 [Streptomyces sp. NPDC057592]|uniref:hypothetical protein n=1 Tax=unclassified Streptomyces TaxID=2593676 RepID=UPI0036CD548E
MTEFRQSLRDAEADDGLPELPDVTDAAQFVEAMRRLRLWADLSYRQLERRADVAGDVLPRTTLSGALSRSELPREQLLVAFVRACGGDEDMVGAWVKARRRLAAKPENPPAAAPARPAAADVPASGVEESPGSEAVEGGDGGCQAAGAGTGTGPEERFGSGKDHASAMSVPTPTRAVDATVPDPSTDDGDPALRQSEVSETAGGQSAPARVPLRRRPKLVFGTSAVFLLVIAAVTGISLLPDDDADKSRAPAIQTPPPSATSPTSAPSVSSTKSASRNKLPDPAGHASPDSTPSTTPSASPKSKQPSDNPASQPPDQEPNVYEPPPPAYTPSPSQSEDDLPDDFWEVLCSRDPNMCME